MEVSGPLTPSRFTPPPGGEEAPSTLLIRWLGGPQSLFGHWSREKSLIPARNQTLVIQLVAHRYMSWAVLASNTMVFQVNIRQFQVSHSSLLQPLVLLIKHFISSGWKHVSAMYDWLDTETFWTEWQREKFQHICLDLNSSCSAIASYFRWPNFHSSFKT